MKKMSVLLTLFVLAAVVLTACAGGNGNNAGSNAGADGTLMPTSEGGLAGTDTAGGTGDTGSLTGTPDSVVVGETPTSAADGAGAGTGTPAAGADTTGTPAAGGDAGGTGTTQTPAAGAGGSTTQTPSASGGTDGTGASTMSDQYVLMSELLTMSVQGTDGEEVGSVAGVVVNRAGGVPVTGGAGDSAGAGAGTGAGSTTSTPAAGAGAGSTTATPAAGGAGMTTTTPSTGGSSGMTGTAAGEPEITYVLVNMTGQGASSSGAAGSGAGSTTATPAAGGSSGSTTSTPAAGGSSGSNAGGSAAGSQSGNQVLVPWEAFASSSTAASSAAGSDSALTLSVDADFAAAPSFDSSMALESGFDADAQAYWAEQGIPVTGQAASGVADDSVLIRGQIGSLNVTDASGQALGQVRDFVVERATGRLVYAVLSGGQAFGGQVFLAPFNVLTWQAGQGQGANLGTFSSSVGAESLTGAPSFNSMDELDLSDTSEVDTYWQSQSGSSGSGMGK